MHKLHYVSIQWLELQRLGQQADECRQGSNVAPQYNSEDKQCLTYMLRLVSLYFTLPSVYTYLRKSASTVGIPLVCTFMNSGAHTGQCTTMAKLITALMSISECIASWFHRTSSNRHKSYIKRQSKTSMYANTLSYQLYRALGITV